MSEQKITKPAQASSVIEQDVLNKQDTSSINIDEIAASMPSLAGRIFRILFIATIITVLFCSIVVAYILVTTLQKEKQNELRSEVSMIAGAVDAVTLMSSDGTSLSPGTSLFYAKLALFESFAVNDIRVTWIDGDGVILFDSGLDDLVTSENHSNRPEFIAAINTGEGSSQRYSTTLKETTYYHALLLDDGTVIRLASTQRNALSMLTALIAPAIIIVVLLGLAALLLARFIARRITAPLLTINLETPLNNTVYEEIVPLLERMDKQRHHIVRQSRDNLATRREFATNVSHELKTPLTVISGYAELMKNGYARPEDTRHFSELIYSEAERMRELVEDILVVSQLDESDPKQNYLERIERIDLRDIVSDCIYRLTPFADQSNVSFHLDATDAAIVAGSHSLLTSMIYNLCENAIRYNITGGSVTISIKESGEKVLLCVSDTGIGIAPKDQEYVFERFFRVDKTRSRTTGGTGLGLSIVKHGASFHGADLVLSSTPAENGDDAKSGAHGTSITLIFPLSSQ
ncbi:MAG: ATP-binding protein [Coriobacteriia bacterium]|nr:ATP-binding protein [Coriobacteriia bacterium]